MFYFWKNYHNHNLLRNKDFRKYLSQSQENSINRKLLCIENDKSININYIKNIFWDKINYSLDKKNLLTTINDSLSKSYSYNNYHIFDNIFLLLAFTSITSSIGYYFYRYNKN